MLKRVVVTGLGLVTPLGGTAPQSWSNILASKSGLGPITRFDPSDLPARVAGQAFDKTEYFNPSAHVSDKDRRRMDDFIVFGLAAADEALKDAGYVADTEEKQWRSGVMVGSGIGGLQEISRTAIELHERGPRRVSPFFIPASLINLVGGQISIRHGLKGPNHAVVTACSTGCHAIGDAGRIIALGDADVMVAGGTEAAICRIGIAGFAAARALSTNFNDTPSKASRPWDKDRDGFVMGEGAGIVVLESLDHALARGARIYAELTGYGMSGDAHHITAPSDDGSGATRSMQAALKRALLNPSDIGYINAHGTSTPRGDEIEVLAVKRVFGDAAYSLAMSSTKSAIGHLLGAAGSVEAIFSILALRDNVMPPTLNLDNPSDGCDLNFVAHQPQQKTLHHVLSNSFGFGGTNASVIFSRFQG
jgi:3-oxoacyl-[acyl-carrier-protein] synthase II